MYDQEMNVATADADVEAIVDRLVRKAAENTSVRERLKEAVDAHAIAALAADVGIAVTPRQLSRLLSLEVMGMAEDELHDIAGAPSRCSWTCSGNTVRLC